MRVVGLAWWRLSARGAWALAVVLSLGGVARAEVITVKPERETEFFVNPDCGWYSVSYGDEWDICKRRCKTEEPFPHASVIYTRRTSKTWETSPGVYDGEPVKVLESWMKHKRRASFRAWAQRHSDLPRWWQEKVRKLPPGNYHNGCDLCFWDDAYVEHHKQLITALGKKWNGSPYLAWVDVGAVGNSGGEWCIFGWEEYEKHGLTREVYLDLCKKIVDIYCEAFPETQLIIAHDCLGTSRRRDELSKFLIERGVGIRNDGLGMGPDKLCYSKGDFLRFYPFLPTIYENVVQWRDGDANTRACLDAALTAHPCWVRAGTNETSSEEVERLAPKTLDEYGKQFGYHIRVKRAQYVSPSSGALNLLLVWTNEGTSPCYVDHGLEISLLTRSAQPVFRRVVKPRPPVPKWMPGEDTPMQLRIELPKGMAGKFALAVRLVHPKGWWPVRLEMKSHTLDWRYILGTVELKAGALGKRPRRTRPEEAPAGPTAEERKKAEEAAVTLREGIIEAAEAGRSATMYVSVMGMRVRGKITGADDEGVTVDARGVTVKLAWEKMSPREFYGTARKFVDDHEALYTYCLGTGLAEEAEAEKAANR